MQLAKIKDIMSNVAKELGIDERFSFCYQKDPVGNNIMTSIVAPLEDNTVFANIGIGADGGYIRLLDNAISHSEATLQGCNNTAIKMAYHFNIVKWSTSNCDITKIWEQLFIKLSKMKNYDEDVTIETVESWFSPIPILQQETESPVVSDVSKLRIAKFHIIVTIDNIDICDLESNFC